MPTITTAHEAAQREVRVDVFAGGRTSFAVEPFLISQIVLISAES